MAADPIDIVTLGEARSFLNIVSTDHDLELEAVITAASQMWVNRYGPVASTAYTETHHGVTGSLALNRYPVLTVTSVTGLGGALTGYAVDNGSGVVRGLLSCSDDVTVVYTAGRAAVPADLHHAVLLLVKHLWETQRGATRRSGTGGADNAGTAFSWPWRVEQIGEAYRQAGFA
jgi:hypothetical protein